jgi:hypothetical protein
MVCVPERARAAAGGGGACQNSPVASYYFSQPFARRWRRALQPATPRGGTPTAFTHPSTSCGLARGTGAEPGAHTAARRARSRGPAAGPLRAAGGPGAAVEQVLRRGAGRRRPAERAPSGGRHAARQDHEVRGPGALPPRCQQLAGRLPWGVPSPAGLADGRRRRRYRAFQVGARPMAGGELQPLYIALHGGGSGPATVNDGQWDQMCERRAALRCPQACCAAHPPARPPSRPLAAPARPACSGRLGGRRRYLRLDGEGGGGRACSLTCCLPAACLL